MNKIKHFSLLITSNTVIAALLAIPITLILFFYDPKISTTDFYKYTAFMYIFSYSLVYIIKLIRVGKNKINIIQFIEMILALIFVIIFTSHSQTYFSINKNVILGMGYKLSCSFAFILSISFSKLLSNVIITMSKHSYVDDLREVYIIKNDLILMYI